MNSRHKQVGPPAVARAAPIGSAVRASGRPHDAGHARNGGPAPLHPSRPQVPRRDCAASLATARDAALHGDAVDVNREIAAGLQAFAETASATGVRIETSFRNRRVPVRSSRAKIRQILVSLFAEAIEIAPPRGIVRVSTAIDESGDPMMAVAVEESPSSRPATQRESRREGSGPRFWGSGPGLALARAIAESLGGRLELGDAAEGGPCVRVYLPNFRRLSRPQA